jgi:hypothetical protein
MSEEQNGQQPNWAEKREFPRIEVNTQVTFTVVIPSYNIGNTRDISQGGLCLETTSKLEKGSIIRLEFDLPGPKPEHVEALGRVMWQRPVENDKLLTGVKFLV